MASIPLPALQVRPQPQQDPMEQYSKLLSLRSLLQGQQLQQQQLRGAQLENQQREYEVGAQQATNESFKNAVKVDPSSGIPTFDASAITNGLAAKGYGSTIPGIMKTLTDAQQSAENLKKTKGEVQTQEANYVGQLAYAAHQAGDDADVLSLGLQHAQQMGYQTAGQALQALQTDPTKAAPIIQHLMGNSPDVQKLITERTAADARKQTAQTGEDKFNLEKPGIMADNITKQANAGVAPQMAQLGVQEKQSSIAKNRAETVKANLESQNLGQQPIFAVDPNTNERVMTTRPEAQAKGYTNPVAVKEGDVSKETDARAMINDVQLNKSRYLSAMQRVYSEPMNTAQKSALVALTPEKLGMDLHFIRLELPDVMQKVTNATAFSVLSPAQKQAVVGYYSTLASVPAAQKALTNIGRSNKEMMDLELRTIPTPIMDAESFNTMLDRFQGNIDQTSRKTVRMPGMPSTQDIRSTYEGQQQPSQQNGTTHQRFPQFLR